MPCELVGLADIDITKRELAKRYGIRYYEDFRNLLPIVDAVTVATPASTHYQIAADCLLAGKHLLVEKPLALNSHDAQELVKLAKQCNLVLEVGHQYRTNPAVLRLKQELENAGNIQYVTLRYANLNSHPPSDCGVIFDYGSHLFDLAIFLLGRTPEKIYCRKSHLSSRSDESALILLDYGGFMVYLELSWLHPLKRRDAWVIASKSSIYVDFLQQTMRKHTPENGPGRVASDLHVDIQIEKREPLKEKLRHFIECVEHDSMLEDHVEEACQVVRLCELALQSGENGCEIAV